MKKSFAASRSLKVLLAEDNKINQQFAVALLLKAGHSVEIAENGLQAVEAVRRSDYDVVLMDIQMPELDGVGATRQIRALSEPKSKVPIVAVTANAMSGAKAEYLGCGMNDYISKPFQPEQLYTLFARLIPERDGTEGKPAPVMSEALPTRTQMEKRAAALAVFDPGNLAILGGSLPPADLRDLLSLHLRDTESRIALIRDLATRGDLAGIAKEAHVMVSTGGNVGALQTSAYARLLEHACKEGDSAAVPRLVEALRESCTAAARALEDWIAAKPLSGQHKQSA